MIIKHNKNTEIALEIERYLLDKSMLKDSVGVLESNGIEKTAAPGGKWGGSGIKAWCVSAANLNPDGNDWLTETYDDSGDKDKKKNPTPGMGSDSGGTKDIKDLVKNILFKHYAESAIKYPHPNAVKVMVPAMWLQAEKLSDGSYVTMGEEDYGTGNKVFNDPDDLKRISRSYYTNFINKASISDVAAELDLVLGGNYIGDGSNNISNVTDTDIEALKAARPDLFLNSQWFGSGPIISPDGGYVLNSKVGWDGDFFNGLTNKQVIGLISCDRQAAPAEPTPEPTSPGPSTPEPTTPEPEIKIPSSDLDPNNERLTILDGGEVKPSNPNNNEYIKLKLDSNKEHIAPNVWYVLEEDLNECPAGWPTIAINSAWINKSLPEADKLYKEYSAWAEEYKTLISKSDEVRSASNSLSICQARGSQADCSDQEAKLKIASENTEYAKLKELLKEAYGKGLVYGCYIGRIDNDWSYSGSGAAQRPGATQYGPPEVYTKKGSKKRPAAKDEKDSGNPEFHGAWWGHGGKGAIPGGDVPLPDLLGEDVVEVQLGTVESGAITVPISIRTFLQGKTETNGRAFDKQIRDILRMPAPASCIMSAMFDPGHPVDVPPEEPGGEWTVRYIYGFDGVGGLIGSNTLSKGHIGVDQYASAYTKSVSRYNEFLHIWYGAYMSGKLHGGPFAPGFVMWYYKHHLADVGPMQFSLALINKCGRSTIPWMELLNQSMDSAKNYFKYTPADHSTRITRPSGKSYHRDPEKATRQLRSDWEGMLNKSYPAWKKEGEILTQRGYIIKNSSTPIYDRIMMNDPDYLSHKIAATNSSGIDSDRAIREFRINKIASNNINKSTNDNELKRDDIESTNFYSDIMKKYADDFLNTYLDDALQDLSKEYAGSFYAGLEGAHKINDNAEEDSYSSYYNVHDETGADLIGSAHPKSINVADAMGNGGLVENAIESGNRMAEIARNTPSGNYRSKHANIVDRLNKLATFASLSGDRQSMKKINIAIRKFIKE